MISILPRDNKWRNQEEAIKHHNSRKEIFMSVADACRLAEENPGQLKELHKDFRFLNWSITSTRIDYNKKTVTHHVESNQTKETTIKLKEIPVCRPTYLKDIISTSSGYAFLKALVNKKKATKEEITQVFELLSGMKAEKIRFWTPTAEYRKERPLRAVRLFFGFGRFSVLCGGWFDCNGGLSRGVKINSAPKEQGKIKQTKNQIYNQAIDDIISKLKKIKK